MRGFPGRIGGKGLEAIGQGELVPLPTGPSHHPPTLCCQLTHTPTHKGWGGLWRAEVCHRGLVSNAPSLLAGNLWAVTTQWGWNRGGTLEKQPPRERGHRSTAPYSEFTNLPWVPQGGISSKSGLCVSPVGKGSEHRDALALGGENMKGPRHCTGPVLLTLFISCHHLLRSICENKSLSPKTRSKKTN